MPDNEQITDSGSQPSTVEGNDKPAIPYDRFQSVNNKLKDTERQLATMLASQKANEEAKLAEQGKYKELLEARESELNTYKTQLAKHRVVSELGLPADLADILSGNTEDELKANATKLLSYMGNRQAIAPTTGATAGHESGNRQVPTIPSLADILKMPDGKARQEMLLAYDNQAKADQGLPTRIKFNSLHQ